MLTFLNLYILPALSLTALPILIHLLTRHRVREQQFSDLRLLEEIHRRQMRKMKLRQWLILILRTLIILFVISAFARPALRGVTFGGVGSHERSAVAILLDNSYSTGAVRGGTDVFTFEKAAANRILSLLQEGDAAAIGAFNTHVSWLTPRPSRFFSNLSAILDTVSLSDQTTDIPAAITEARRMLKSYTAPNKEIYILTDAAASGWRTRSDFDTSSDISVFVLAIPPDREENRTIVAAEFPPQLLEVGGHFELGAVLKNNGRKTVQGVVISLVLDGRKTSQTITEVSAGAQIVAQLTGQTNTGGFHWGYVECSDDNLHSDNRRYLTFRIPERIRVMIVGKPEQRRFFKLALSPESRKEFFELSERTEAQLESQLFSAYDVVVLLDPASIADAALGRLRAFVSDGGGLLIMPGERAARNLSSYQKITRNFGAINAIAAIGDTTQFAQLGWGKSDIAHPVLAAFAETELPQVILHRVIQFSIRDGQVFLRFENNMPALADVPLGDGRIIIAGFSVDMRWGNLPISGFFVPMAHRICQYLASDVAYFDVGYPVGSDISRTIQGFSGTGRLQVHTPGGGGIFVAPRFIGGKPSVFIKNLPKAGIYTVVSSDDTLDMFAANVPPAEGNLTPLNSQERKNLPVHWFNPNADLAKQILATRYGVELWQPLLLLALILMAAEMIIETRWKQRQPKGSQ